MEMERTKKLSVVLLSLIIANYVSMAAGTFLGVSIGANIGFDYYDPKNNTSYLIQHFLYYTGFTIASMIIEFPFFLFIMIEYSRNEILKTSLIIIAISALIVIAMS